MKTLRTLLNLGMILALAFSVTEVEAKKRSHRRHSAPRCQGMLVNCSNNGDIMKCLTCNATREALYKQGIDAMIRVNRVVMSRSKSGQYPKNICSVIHQKYQFSWTPRPMTCTTQAVWAQAQEASKIALERQGNGKLFFHGDYVRPRWARYCVGKEQPRGDTHVYYSQCFGSSSQLARYKRANPNEQYASADGYGSRGSYNSGDDASDFVDVQARSGR